MRYEDCPCCRHELNDEQEPWSVTDDFVDPNRQPAGDQEPW